MELLQKEYESSESDNSKEENKSEKQLGVKGDVKVSSLPPVIKVDLAPEVDISDLMLQESIKEATRFERENKVDY